MTPNQVYEHARLCKAVRRGAAGWLWLANVAIGCVVAGNLLVHVEGGLKAWLFALGALVSTVAFLSLAPGLCATLAAHVVKRPRLLGGLQASMWTLFHVLLFVDTRIYNIFRYHWNGQVINVLYTGGSEDSIHLGWQVWSSVTLGLLGMGALQLFLWRRALKRSVEDDHGLLPRRLVLRPAFVWAAVILPAVFVEKTLYAQAELARDQGVTALSRIFPMYPALKVEEAASTILGMEVDARPRFELGRKVLRYPLSTPVIDAAGPRPNVLLLVVDCLRADMVSPEVMPRTHAFAREALAFQDHLSGGNSTRFGLLSLLYGLHGSYWFPILAERRPPVMLDALMRAGYEPGVFATASQNYPELRATAWSSIPDKVHDDFPGVEAWRRDEQSSAALIEWLEERARLREPFFGFLLLDAPHQTYSHPPDVTPFLPSAPELDYMAMSRNEGPDPALLAAVFNRYRNAVYHADLCLGNVYDALAATGLDQSTIVVVTGDHGEEFREHGFFGHTSAYTAPQVHVPFLMRGPGVEPGVETRPTSHLDLPATILEMLGADPAARAGYTVGGSLLDPPDQRRRVIGGWNELGVWIPDAIVRVPLSGWFEIEVYDRAWNLIHDDERYLADEQETLERLAEECSRFLADD